MKSKLSLFNYFSYYWRFFSFLITSNWAKILFLMGILWIASFIPDLENVTSKDIIKNPTELNMKSIYLIKDGNDVVVFDTSKKGNYIYNNKIYYATHDQVGLICVVIFMLIIYLACIFDRDFNDSIYDWKKCRMQVFVSLTKEQEQDGHLYFTVFDRLIGHGYDLNGFRSSSESIKRHLSQNLTLKELDNKEFFYTRSTSRNRSINKILK